MPDPTLEVDRLVRTAGRRRILDGVSLGVGAGEVVGLLGPNGAGKTTTLKIVMGFERPDSGDVRLGGVSILGRSIEARAALGIGYLPQDPSIFPDLDLEKNVSIVLEALGRDVSRAHAVLDDMAIGHLARQKAGSLSGGERRRLEVARLLALDPGTCLLDEPFTGMDPMSIARIAGVVRGLRASGKAVILSDHNVRQTVRLCDRVALLDHGRVIVAGTPDEVLANPEARARYLGDPAAS